MFSVLSTAAKAAPVISDTSVVCSVTTESSRGDGHPSPSIDLYSYEIHCRGGGTSTYIDPLPCIPFDPISAPCGAQPVRKSIPVCSLSLLQQPTERFHPRRPSLRYCPLQQTDTRVRPLEPYRKCRSHGPPTWSSVASIICCAPQFVIPVSRYLARSLRKADRVWQGVRPSASFP